MLLLREKKTVVLMLQIGIELLPGFDI
jgi:hypothetical protein